MKEEVNHYKYYDSNVARKAIFEYIECWYNRKKILGSIGYMTPHAVHSYGSVVAQKVNLFVPKLSTQVQAKNYLFYIVFYLLEINFTKEDIGGYKS